MNAHICQSDYQALPSMRDLYSHLGVIATSEVADIVLIRSWLAYHRGQATAERASIRPSRGCSYRIAAYGKHGQDDERVKIVDYYDHREGVQHLQPA